MIDLLPEQKGVEDLGGTMRLGAQAVELAEGTRTRELYRGEPVIPSGTGTATRSTTRSAQRLVEAGLVVSGTFQEGRLVEIVELPDHPWFVASSSTRSSSRGRRGRRRSSAGSSRARAARTRRGPGVHVAA